MRGHVGNVGILVRAWAYIRAHGADGLREVQRRRRPRGHYLRGRLVADGAFESRFAGPCAHEFIASGAGLKRATGVRTLDVAKRLIDKGYHPPTIYFPHTVDEAMLIEPTETERLETLDAFADALLEIAQEAHRPRSS